MLLTLMMNPLYWKVDDIVLLYFVFLLVISGLAFMYILRYMGIYLEVLMVF